MRGAGLRNHEVSRPNEPRRALLKIYRSLTDETIAITDIGNVCSTSNGYLKLEKGCKFTAALTFGNCGFAYPASLGAQLARLHCLVMVLKVRNAVIIAPSPKGASTHELLLRYVQEKLTKIGAARPGSDAAGGQQEDNPRADEAGGLRATLA